MSREELEAIDIEQGISDVHTKLMCRLRDKGFHTLASRHEILGILEEEMHELREAVQSGDMEDVRAELLDVAVAAAFGLMSLDKGLDW